jgi:hypothetical protein
MPVAVEVGDVWPANRGGSEVVDAVDPGTDIGFFMDQTVDDLLRPASRNEVKADGANLTISMTPAKMSVLMSRARDCRAAMRGDELSRRSFTANPPRPTSWMNCRCLGEWFRLFSRPGPKSMGVHGCALKLTSPRGGQRGSPTS